MSKSSKWYRRPLMVMTCILFLLACSCTSNTKETVESDHQMEKEAAVTSQSEQTNEPASSLDDSKNNMEMESVEVMDEAITEDSSLQKVEEVLDSMTLEEKIYQMFIVSPEQLTSCKLVTTAGKMTKKSLESHPVGGVIYFSQNLITPEQTKKMLHTTQSYADEIEGISLFLCVDEEGGRVARIANNEAFEVEQVGAMGDIKNVDAAYEAGVTIGSYLYELGFNWDFAPDADVLTNPDNTVIGDRSFGSDPSTVSTYATAVSNGLQEAGIMSTMKHFPGHGATEGDTHEGFAYTNQSYDELTNQELVPFKAAQEAGVDAIMVAHISVPNVIGDNTPSSLSNQMVTKILREDLGYQGLIITDALNMGAVTKAYDSATAAVMAVQAGNDLLLMPQNLMDAVRGIKEAIANGDLTEERINESVRRILFRKLEL